MSEKKSLIVLNYNDEPQHRVISAGEGILSSMINAPQFAPCWEDVKAFQKVYDEFVIVNVRAKTNNKQDVADRKALVKQMRPILNQVAQKANSIIGQDHSLAILSGLLLRTESGSGQRKTHQAHIRKGSISYDYSGETIHFSCIRVDGARMYECVYHPYKRPDAAKSINTATHHITLKDLDLALRYAVKIRTVNSKDESSEWSETVML